jgi:hypothetical protein
MSSDCATIIEFDSDDRGHSHSGWPWHRRHHRHVTRRVSVTLILKNTDQPITLQGTAQYPDPENAGAFLTDPNGVLSWTASPDGLVTLTDNGTTTGVGTVGVAYEAAGAVTVQAVATDPDGNVTPASAAFEITCVDTATDATQVVVTLLDDPNSDAPTPTPAPAADETPAAS